MEEAATELTAPQTDTTAAACLLGANAVVRWYNGLVAQGHIARNEQQEEAVRLLQTLADTLEDADAPPTPLWQNPLGTLHRWLTNGNGGSGKTPAANHTRGIYLHGSVGCGKSLLMDGFYLQLPVRRKLRVHFHQFMRRLHEDMKTHEREPDPLLYLARRLARRYAVICFDEFHVSDITDAMLLGRLVDILLDAGVRFVMTSNYPPTGLYPNGLARDRFLPTIELIKSTLTVFGFGEQPDYRQQCLAQHRSYWTPADAAARTQMQALFAQLSCGIEIRQPLRLANRTVPVTARGPDCVWFDFKTLCADARSKQDYLQLAERFATIFLSDVPPLDKTAADAARRFTWLVDILYDERVQLIMSSDSPLAQLYGEGDGGESGRTLSRLVEMQSNRFTTADKQR